MLPEEEDKEAPEILTELMPLLSEATTVYVTVWLLLLTLTLELLVENEEIVGDWVSFLLMVILVVSVLLLPAISVTVAVKVSLVEPHP